MNASNICRLANFIANNMEDFHPPIHKYDYQTGQVFDMELYLSTLVDDEASPCGTAGCIAGSIELMRKTEMYQGLTDQATITAASFLGLTHSQGTELFAPKDIIVKGIEKYSFKKYKWKDIKKKHAVYVLRNMVTKKEIYHGLIDKLWERAFEKLGP